MPSTDRNLLRIAVYELRFLPEDSAIDDAVVINEAVEIAKAYGTDESSRFVNGVLGRISRMDVLPEPEADDDTDAVDAEAESGADDAMQVESGDSGCDLEDGEVGMADTTVKTFDDITERLDEIITQVRSKDTSLERSLDLFDEAIRLGSKAVDIVDQLELSPREALCSKAETLAASDGAPSDGDD